MSEETAKALVEAMNRFAAAIEALPRDLMGIKVHHQGGLAQQQYPLPYNPWYQTNWPGGYNAC
jgi:hypothetical protein